MVDPTASVVTETTVAVTVTVTNSPCSNILLEAERSAAITALEADSSADAIALEAEA